MKLNKSKTYLLPLFASHVDIRFIENLLNTYVFFNNEYYFCLRYKYSGKKEFVEYEQQLEKSKHHKYTIDINKNEVVYVFDIPENMFDAVDLFLDGKYSYLPNKENIILYLVKNFGVNGDSKIIKILNRDEELKKEIEEELNIKIPDGLDLSSVPDIENENFIYQEITELNERE